LHEASQSGHVGGRETDIHTSRLNQGRRGGTGLCNELDAYDGSSRETHALESAKFSPLKNKLISGSH